MNPKRSKPPAPSRPATPTKTRKGPTHTGRTRGKPAKERTTAAFQTSPRHLAAFISATAGRAAAAGTMGLVSPLPPLRLPPLKDRRPDEAEIAEVVAELERAVQSLVTADGPEDCEHYVPRPDIVQAFRALVTVALRWAAKLNIREVKKAQQRSDIARALLVAYNGFSAEAQGEQPDVPFRWPQGGAPSRTVRDVLERRGVSEAVVHYAAERTGTSRSLVQEVVAELSEQAPQHLVPGTTRPRRAAETGAAKKVSPRSRKHRRI